MKQNKIEVELKNFLFSLGCEVVKGSNTREPYDGNPYVSVGLCYPFKRKEEEDAKSKIINDFKSKVIQLVSGNKRMIIRNWPEFKRIDNLTRETPLFSIYFRLLCDDGNMELNSNPEFRKDRSTPCGR